MHHKEIGKEGENHSACYWFHGSILKKSTLLKVDILDQQLWQIQKSKWLRKQVYFGFRRDLRWHDNHALLKAFLHSEDVIPIFIFDTNIIDRLDKNDRRVSLIFDRLQKLNAEIGQKNKHSARKTRTCFQ